MALLFYSLNWILLYKLGFCSPEAFEKIPIAKGNIYECEFDKLVNCSWKKNNQPTSIKRHFEYITGDGYNTKDCSVKAITGTSPPINLSSYYCVGIMAINNISNNYGIHGDSIKNLNEGDSIDLNCSISSNLTCDWKRDGHLIDIGGRYKYLVSETNTSHNCSIRLTNVTEIDFKEWKCHNSNTGILLQSYNLLKRRVPTLVAQTQETRSSKVAEITSTDSPSFHLNSTSLTEQPGISLTVVNLILTCSVVIIVVVVSVILILLRIRSRRKEKKKKKAKERETREYQYQMVTPRTSYYNQPMSANRSQADYIYEEDGYLKPIQIKKKEHGKLKNQINNFDTDHEQPEIYHIYDTID